MSELCRFHGIVIRMFHREHPPPHFHAVYGEYEATVDVATLTVSEGFLPVELSEWFSVGQTRGKPN